MLFELSFGHAVLVGVLGNDGLPYWEIFSIGKLLGVKNLINFSAKHYVYELSDVVFLHRRQDFSIETLKTKLITDEKALRLLQKSKFALPQFVFRCFTNGFKVKAQRRINRFPFVRMSNEDGNEQFSQWLKSYFQELLFNPYPQLRSTISHVETHIVSSNPAAPVPPPIATLSPSPTYGQTFSGLSPPDHDLVMTPPTLYVPASPPQLVISNGSPICLPSTSHSVPPTYRPSHFASPDISKPPVQWGTAPSPTVLLNASKPHPLSRSPKPETVFRRCSNQPFSSPNHCQQQSAAAARIICHTHRFLAVKLHY